MRKSYLLIILTLLVLSLALYGCTPKPGPESNDTNGTNESENPNDSGGTDDNDSTNNTDDSEDIDWQAKLDEKDETIRLLEDKISLLEDKIKELEEDVQSSNLLSRSIEAINLIKEKNLDELSSYVHPDKGVRITPYPNVDVNEDQVFEAEDLPGLFEDSQTYTWGSYDGSGETIELNFSDYYDEFIYDADFADPELIGNNTIIGEGNTIENVEEAYPDGEFVEFYFSEIDPQYSGMDWRSLKLVFEEKDSVWYLVGIIHGEWTI